MYIRFVLCFLCCGNEGQGETFSKQAAARSAINTAMQFCHHAIPIFMTQASCCILVQSLCGQTLLSTNIFIVFNDGKDWQTSCQLMTCVNNGGSVLTTSVGGHQPDRYALETLLPQCSFYNINGASGKMWKLGADNHRTMLVALSLWTCLCWPLALFLSNQLTNLCVLPVEELTKGQVTLIFVTPWLAAVIVCCHAPDKPSWRTLTESDHGCVMPIKRLSNQRSCDLYCWYNNAKRNAQQQQWLQATLPKLFPVFWFVA